MEGELNALPFAKPTVKQDVAGKLVAYLLERQEDFPGVEPEREFLREYPHGVIGAHLFGQVGEVSPEELKDTRFNGVAAGDRVGKAGNRVRVRPLPARAQWRGARGGGRAREPHEDAATAASRSRASS